MRVMEWPMWLTASLEMCVSEEEHYRVSTGGFHPSARVAECIRRNPPLCEKETSFSPLHRLEVFVFLHQLSSQFTIYLPWTVLTFSGSHLWQIPDTLGQASLEASNNITHNCQYKGKPTHGLAHWLGLPLYLHINLSSIRQVGGGSGRCSHEEWR